MTDELDALAADLANAVATLDHELDTTPVDTGCDVDGAADAPPPPPPSPNVIAQDDWSLTRGRAWLRSEHCPQALIDKLAEPSTPANFAADMLALSFNFAPQLAENPVNTRLGHFVSTLMQTPQFEAMHNNTRLKLIPSEMAATAFASQFVEMCKSPEPEDELERDAQAVGAVNDALSEAQSGVDSYTNACRGLGGDGSEESLGMNPGQVREMFNTIRENPTLRRIMELAGRYQRLAQSIQASKPTHGMDEVVGINLGSDIGHLLPSELSMLTDPDREDLFYQRFADKKLFQYELSACTQEARGPVVVVVDESGSMHGNRVCEAKAFALAMAWIARHQKRWMCFVGFAGGTTGNYLVQPPGEQDTSALLDWLAHFYSGGTRCDVPLVELPQMWPTLGCPAGRTDVIIITDGIVNVPTDVRDDFNAWKEQSHAHTNLIVIGEGEAGDMESVADSVFLPSSFNLDAAGVFECLSI